MDQNPYQSQDQHPSSGAFHPINEHDQDPYHNRKQSGLGIASFIIGLLCIIGIIALSMTTVVSLTDAIQPDGTLPDTEELASSSEVIIAGILMLFTILISLVGLVLGIVSLFMKNRRKVFGIIGVVLNGLLVVGFGGLMVLGMAVQGM